MVLATCMKLILTKPEYFERKHYPQNGCGLLTYWTLESAVSQEWIDESNLFSVCWYKFRKTKSYFSNCWVSVIKNGHGLFLGQGTLKSVVFQEWFFEMSIFFHAVSDAIIFADLTLHLWLLNAWGPLQLYFSCYIFIFMNYFRV